jgi:hypothetical protein
LESCEGSPRIQILNHQIAIVISDWIFQNGGKLGAMIEVKHSGGAEWLVTVKGSVTTQHKVRVTKVDLDRWAGGRTAEELLSESFRFLLEREPNTSILAAFDLPLIGNYFPEYDREIRARMRPKDPD